MKVLLLIAAITLALVGGASAKIALNGKNPNLSGLNGVSLNLTGMNGTALAADGGTDLNLGALTVVKATIRR